MCFEFLKNLFEHSVGLPFHLFHSWPLMKSSSSPSLRPQRRRSDSFWQPKRVGCLKGEIDLLRCRSSIHSSLSKLHLSHIKPTFLWLNGIVPITPLKFFDAQISLYFFQWWTKRLLSFEYFRDRSPVSIVCSLSLEASLSSRGSWILI